MKEDYIAGADVEKRAPEENDGLDELEQESRSMPASRKAYTVDNWEAVEDVQMKKVVREGGRIERNTRVSLTCRDVEKTRKVGLLGIVQR